MHNRKSFTALQQPDEAGLLDAGDNGGNELQEENEVAAQHTRQAKY